MSEKEKVGRNKTHEEREVKFESEDEVELPNGRIGTVIDFYKNLFENTYDIDLSDGIVANQVLESDLELIE